VEACFSPKGSGARESCPPGGEQTRAPGLKREETRGPLPGGFWVRKGEKNRREGKNKKRVAQPAESRAADIVPRDLSDLLPWLYLKHSKMMIEK